MTVSPAIGQFQRGLIIAQLGISADLRFSPMIILFNPTEPMAVRSIIDSAILFLRGMMLLDG
ncbi:hypothetical protein C0557_01840 [Kosakonia sp. MUSA4]|nr:hypothetical protein C0557_01840 [Kosakonia sp. MUSA4]